MYFSVLEGKVSEVTGKFRLLITGGCFFAVEQSSKAIRAPSFACNYKWRAGIVLPSVGPLLDNNVKRESDKKATKSKSRLVLIHAPVMAQPRSNEPGEGGQGGGFNL